MRALLIGVGSRPAAIVNEMVRRGASPFSEFPRQVTLTFKEAGTGKEVENVTAELVTSGGRKGVQVDRNTFLIGEEEYDIVLKSEEYELAEGADSSKVRPGRYDTGKITINLVRKSEGVQRRFEGVIRILSRLLPFILFFAPLGAFYLMHPSLVDREVAIFLVSYTVLPFLLFAAYTKYETPIYVDEPLLISLFKSLLFSLLMLLSSFLSFLVIRGYIIGSYDFLSLANSYLSRTDPLLLIPFLSPFVNPLIRLFLKLKNWYVELPTVMEEEWSELEGCFLDRHDDHQGYLSRVAGIAILKGESASVDLSCLESSSKLLNRVSAMEYPDIKEPIDTILYCTGESSYRDHAEDTARAIKRIDDLMVRVCSSGLNAVVVLMDSSAPLPDREFSLEYGSKLIAALRDILDVPVVPALIWNSDLFGEEDLVRVISEMDPGLSVLLFDPAVLSLGLRSIESRFRALTDGMVVRLMPLLEGGEVQSKEGFDASHLTSTLGYNIGVELPPSVAVVGYSKINFEQPHPCRSDNCFTPVLVKNASEFLSYVKNLKLEEGTALLLIRGAVDKVDLIRVQSYLKRTLGTRSVVGVADVKIDGAKWVELILLVARIPISRTQVGKEEEETGGSSGDREEADGREDSGEFEAIKRWTDEEFEGGKDEV